MQDFDFCLNRIKFYLELKTHHRERSFKFFQNRDQYPEKGVGIREERGQRKNLTEK